MLVVRLPDDLRAERGYAAHVVFGAQLGVAHRVQFEERGDVRIDDGDLRGPALTMPDVLFAGGANGWPGRAARPASAPPVFALDADEGGNASAASLPVLFGRVDAEGRWWQLDAKNAYLGVDVLGTAFWLTSRLEEQLDTARDAHGRFPASASHAARGGYLHRPILDEWVDVLAGRLRRLWPDLQPLRHRYAPRVTHDVDRPYKYLFRSPARLLLSMASDVGLRKDVKSALRAPRLWLRVRGGDDGADPYFSFDWLMDQSERANLRSTFFFLCGGGARRLDGDYEIGHPRVRALLRRIRARGHEIGLHASYHTMRRPDLLRQEAETLRRVCAEEHIEQSRWSVRQHVLRFDAGVTPEAWERAGLTHDSTLGYADRAGFRCGSCRPFPLFDLAARRMLKVTEHPLIAMDVTLMDGKYEALDPAAALRRILGLRDACSRVGGEFVLLWHNCLLETVASREVFSGVLREARPDS